MGAEKKGVLSMRDSAFHFAPPLVVSLGLTMAACDAFGPDTADEPDQPSVAADASPCGPPVDAAAGSGTISGLVNGAPFDSVATSLWIGAPDSPSTTVVFLLSRPTGCSELCSPGWDTRIRANTQILEIKMVGTTPATFAVVAGVTPGLGEAATTYTLSANTGVPNEIGGSGGTVTLTTLAPAATAAGRFTLAFGGGEDLDGIFDAAFCSGGHEP
jgi:hypothetical protein